MLGENWRRFWVKGVRMDNNWSGEERSTQRTKYQRGQEIKYSIHLKQWCAGKCLTASSPENKTIKVLICSVVKCTCSCHVSYLTQIWKKIGHLGSCDPVSAALITLLTIGIKGTIGRCSEAESPWIWMCHTPLHTVLCKIYHPMIPDTYKDL